MQGVFVEMKQLCFRCHEYEIVRGYLCSKCDESYLRRKTLRLLSELEVFNEIMSEKYRGI